MLSKRRPFAIVSVTLSVLILTLGGAINVALSMMRQPPSRGTTTVAETAVATLTARRQLYCEQLTGYGKARPITSSEVAAGVSGEIVWRSPQLEPGTYVEKGTELVRIDDRDLRGALATATARVVQAKEVLRQQQIAQEKVLQLRQLVSDERDISERTHQRMEQLLARSAASTSEVETNLLQHTQRERALLELEQQAENAQPEVERAQAEVAAAEATREQAATDLERATIVAPYDGFIDERFISLGVRVSIGSPLFEIVDTSQIEVPIAIPASQYSYVKVGSAAKIQLTEDGPFVWQGSVSRISPVIDETDRTFFAYINIPGGLEHPLVPAGAFVVANIEASRHEQVFVVPRTAIVGQQIFVAAGVDHSSSKTIATNASVVEQRTPRVRKLLTSVALLDSGLADGEQLIVSNVEKIAHGSSVVVTNPVGDAAELAESVSELADLTIPASYRGVSP